MIFSILMFYLNFLNFIKCDYFCNKHNEIHYKTSCYRLYDINLIINFNNCILLNQSISIDCFYDQINKFLKLYTLNSFLDFDYEFTALKSLAKDEISSNILSNLIEQKKSKYFNFINILFNLYSFKNHGYLKNQPFKIETPNLLKHTDDENEVNSTDKCLYVHQTQNFNEKFNFKYGSCNKKNSFICIKAPQNVNDIQDRCSSYSDSVPGGKWIECDRLFKIFDENSSIEISESQKCCLYSLDWKVDFFTANKICSKFNSEVFSFKFKGYTSMLNSYDLYMDENKINHNINFWTSCKLTEQSHEPICNQDHIDEAIDYYDISQPIDNGFLIYYFNYSYKTGLSINHYNITHLLKASNETTNELIKNFTLNTFLLVQRKESHASRLISRVKDSLNLDCFSYRQNSEITLSLPFLDKCLNFITNKNQSLSLLNEIIYYESVLDVIDLLTISCFKNINLGKNKFILSSDKNNFTNVLIKNDTSLYPKTKWKLDLWNYLFKSNSSLVYLNYSEIEKILKPNCYDSALKLHDLIEECQKFNDDFYCKFECPDNCDYNSDKNQVLSWQLNKFKYLTQSSICKSAYHSNTIKGLIYFSSSLQSENLIFLNNDIQSIKPLFMNTDNKIFYFSTHSINSNSKLKLNNKILVMVKAIHFVNKLKLNFIDIKLFSYFVPNDKIKFKLLIPLLDDFYDIDFDQQINNFKAYYLTYLNISLPYKKLILINNYLEIYDIKFPINFMNSYYLLNNHQVINDENVLIQAVKISNNTRKVNCNWHLYNLNTNVSCSNNLVFKQTSSHDFIFYPKTEGKEFLKIFSRVIYTSNHTSIECHNQGLLVNNNCLCYPGFGGNNCENVCKRGFFGFDCEFECPDDSCIGQLICNHDPIGCSCGPGYTGYICNQDCPKGTWGPKCMFKCDLCPNNECDRFDGSCFCNENSLGKYCEKCIDGFYGINCLEKCNNKCLKCDKVNGSCLIDSITSTAQTTTKIKTTVITTTNTTCSTSTIVSSSIATTFINILNKTTTFTNSAITGSLKSTNTTLMTKTSSNYFTKCFYLLSTWNCNGKVYHQYKPVVNDYFSKSIVCIQNETTRYLYCNFEYKFLFNECIETVSNYTDNIFCKFNKSLDFENMIYLDTFEKGEGKFWINKLNDINIEKFYLILLNSSKENDFFLLNNLSNKAFVSFYSVCNFKDFISIKFGLRYQSLCNKDHQKNSMPVKLSNGAYDLYSIIEIIDSNKTIWIKSKKFSLSFNLNEKIELIKLNTTCEGTCSLESIEIETQCETINSPTLIVIGLFTFFLILLSDNLVEIFKKNQAIDHEDEKFLFNLEFKSIFPSSF